MSNLQTVYTRNPASIIITGSMNNRDQGHRHSGVCLEALASRPPAASINNELLTHSTQ